MIYTE